MDTGINWRGGGEGGSKSEQNIVYMAVAKFVFRNKVCVNCSEIWQCKMYRVTHT